jgi:hypothetical protein
MPSTAAGLYDVASGQQININDPNQNLEGGAEYFSQLVNQYGNYQQAILAYKGVSTSNPQYQSYLNMANQIIGNSPALTPSYQSRYGANQSPATQILNTAAQGQAPSWLSGAYNVAFVIGGLALIVASVYTAMHSTTVLTQASNGVKGLLSS